MKIDGTVVFGKASIEDGLFEEAVFFQLVSCDKKDNETLKGKVCPHKAYLMRGKAMSDTTHKITFDWPSGYGTPGAILVRNKHSKQFFLEYVSIYVPGQGDFKFVCNSWVYPMSLPNSGSTDKRVFFVNKSYVQKETPEGLELWRKEELEKVKGDDTKIRESSDRIYGYDVYNDLGKPNNDEKKILGGSKETPYPRRCRTGRHKENGYETGVSQGFFYIPSDESSLSLSRILDDFFKKLSSNLGEVISSIPHLTSSPKVLNKHFRNLEEVRSLYNIEPSFGKEIMTSDQMENGISNSEGKANPIFPKPNIISKDDNAWRKDEEFARQTLSGTNPMVIKRLDRLPYQEDSEKSSITEDHLLPFLEGMQSVEKAITEKKLFTLDYYDVYMPYVERINKQTTNKIYATRAIFFLQDDGTLKLIAIELCLPDDKRVFTPNYSGKDEGWLWELAKAHVRSNDSGYHQLVNHWLRTHAVVEPFIIATHRNLSKLHPLHKLLLPHFRNTMHINSAARQLLINAGGIIEKCFSAGQFAAEISSRAYNDWKFNEQGLPADLIKRGMATEEEGGGLKLVIKDYPYAVDGLEIWEALKSWVDTYTSLYYSNDESVGSDEEIQAWWKEIIEVGHGDNEHREIGWYNMKTLKGLREAITTLIWVASAHHAAVNFGQYDYAGFMPSQPSTTRELLPQEGSNDQYAELLRDPEAYFLKTVTGPESTTLSMTVLQVLSTHSPDEVYLGQGSTADWVDDPHVDIAYKEFGQKLVQIEENISARNKDSSLKNRCGHVMLPYTLLFPNISDETKTGGKTFKGIPNSISI